MPENDDQTLKKTKGTLGWLQKGDRRWICFAEGILESSFIIWIHPSIFKVVRYLIQNNLNAASVVSQTIYKWFPCVTWIQFISFRPYHYLWKVPVWNTPGLVCIIWKQEIKLAVISLTSFISDLQMFSQQQLHIDFKSMINKAEPHGNPGRKFHIVEMCRIVLLYWNGCPNARNQCFQK